MNVLFGLFLLAVSILFGYLYSNKYSDRKTFFENFYTFNEKIKSEVSFKKRTLLDISKEYLNSKDHFFKCIYYFYNNKNDFPKKINFLNDEEYKEFLDYLGSVGKFDKDTSLDYLNNYNKILSDKCKIVKDDEKKYKNLYLKLGVLIGLLLFIVLL